MTQQKTKQLTINISDEEHEALRRAAFVAGIPTAALIAQLARIGIARTLASPEFRAKAVEAGFNLTDIDRMAAEAADAAGLP